MVDEQSTGFRIWLSEKAQQAKQLVCFFVGHAWNVSDWHRSPNTAHTHWRDHVCQRCGLKQSENAYFDARNRDAWPKEAP